jgi:hypothetical protein
MMAKLERHKFVYKPRDAADGDKIGYVPPTLDMHGRPLVYPQLVHHENPAATRVITAGMEFDTNDEHEIAFFKSHPEFRRHWGN